MPNNPKMEGSSVITTYVQPQVFPMTWQDFCTRCGAFSIALDGFVKSGPRFNPTGPWLNLNHHEGVDRLATRATCAQALLLVRSGLFETFKDQASGLPRADLFVNDCDEDVCLSTFILQNSHLAMGTMNPLLNRLVFMEDMLDSTAGSYPFPKELGALHELLWVFQPYHYFRASGQIDRRDSEAFRSIITDVHARIAAYIAGQSKAISPDTRFEVMSKNSNIVMVKETGANARLGIYDEGWRAFISVRKRPDGKYAYSIGRFSRFIDVPIPVIIKLLNQAEGNDPTDQWGGSDIIAGSPRVRGSKLTPSEVFKIVSRAIKDSHIPVSV